MKKIAFFAPTTEIARAVSEIIVETNRDDIEVFEVPTARCVEYALEAVQNGVEIIIARGAQAATIKSQVPVSVVEVVLTAQEIGLAISRAKREINKVTPTIGVVGHANMFCDMKHFEELFDIHLRLYYVKDTKDLRGGVEKAASDQVDVLIGGDIVCNFGRELGLNCRLQPCGEDSIRQSFRVATSVAFAAEQEKKVISELNTLLNFSFNGLFKVDNGGTVKAHNQQIEALFGRTTDEIIGSHIDNLLPSFFKEKLQPEVLLGGEDKFSVIQVNGLVLSVNAAPIRIDNKIEGAIVSCYEVRRLSEIEAVTRREMLQSGETIYPFQNFFIDDSIFMHNVEHYAQFDEPVIISSKPGIPRETPARILHQHSSRSTGAFVPFSCSAWPPEKHSELLFGSKADDPGSLIAQANGGILFLDDVDALSAQAQHQLYNLIVHGSTPTDVDYAANIRLIAGTEGNLLKGVEKGLFRKDLYYALSTLFLQLPEFDAEHWASVFILQYCTKYSRFLTMTKAAKNIIAEHKWQGSLIELDSFCKRLVITAPQRHVDDALITRMLKNGEAYDTPEHIFHDPEASRLSNLLEQFGGNRALVAEALNISKTTLWRKMKKHGLFDYY